MSFVKKKKQADEARSLFLEKEGETSRQGPSFQRDQPEPQRKRCSMCGVEKEEESFYRTKTGLKSSCKSCFKEERKKRYQRRTEPQKEEAVLSGAELVKKKECFPPPTKEDLRAFVDVFRELRSWQNDVLAKSRRKPQVDALETEMTLEMSEESI